MFEIITKYSTLWYQIGLKLNLANSVLDNIEADESNQRDRFKKTLDSWLMQDGENATWGLLELAITNVNREHLGLKPLVKCKLYTNV